MTLIPTYRAKSNERKNTYVEGLLIGVDEELGLCTIRTKDDYIGGEVCYLHTLSINFPDMLDSQGNKIFASLQEDGRGGDIFILGDIRLKYIAMIRKNQLMAKQQGTYGSFIGQGYATVDKWKSIGIQQ